MRVPLTLLLLLLAVATHAAAPAGPAPRTGMLLVATEQLHDTRFQQSVILITRHDLRGTTGLVLNRQLGKLPEDLERHLRTLPQGVFWGGPVAPLQVHALLFNGRLADGKPLASGLHLLNRRQFVALLHEAPAAAGELRVFLGYAGWAPTQLARELARGDWRVLPLHVPSLRRLPPEQMWPQLAPQSPAPWI